MPAAVDVYTHKTDSYSRYSQNMTQRMWIDDINIAETAHSCGYSRSNNRREWIKKWNCGYHIRGKSIQIF